MNTPTNNNAPQLVEISARLEKLIMMGEEVIGHLESKIDNISPMGVTVSASSDNLCHEEKVGITTTTSNNYVSHMNKLNDRLHNNTNKLNDILMHLNKII